MARRGGLEVVYTGLAKALPFQLPLSAEWHCSLARRASYLTTLQLLAPAAPRAG